MSKYESYIEYIEFASAAAADFVDAFFEGMRKGASKAEEEPEIDDFDQSLLELENEELRATVRRLTRTLQSVYAAYETLGEALHASHFDE